MSLVKCCFDSELPDFVESVIQKCTDPGCCCGCCSALRPRYKRLVDNIFPVTPQDGLVKNNMEKLTFYSLSSPEKLDRIGEYLFQKASRDIYRRRNGFVIIAMEAMDQLLVACHAQTLNLFVESFLKMVQKLLESTDPQLQILATQSFVRFANIEEDTPSYHRRYDFFVSKFSSMCHSNHPEKETRDQIRLAGIRGLQGVVRKTICDDLVENIWEANHMDKIVPSLLFNMQNSSYEETKEESTPARVVQEERCDPPALAETCMRELVGRASFGHIRCVLKPVLRHLDNHSLWVPNQFAIHTFRIIIFSIQAQYSYTVVEMLMSHLDENAKSNPKIRTSIADVLSKIIAIAAGESVGPSVLEIINSLLTHLRVSVTHESPDGGFDKRDEQQYQEALINALGEFANHLPDFQKIEIMMFIMSKVPTPSIDNLRGFSKEGDVLLQNILLKSLLKVGTKYQTIHFNTTFPLSFLEPLLRMSLAADPDMRLLVHKILHTLIDRHNNLEKLLKPTIHISELELLIEKPSRPDMIFLRKHGPDIYLSVYESLEQGNNTVENIEACYTTLALLCVELCSEETLADFIRLLISIQDMALTNSQLTLAQRFNIHAVVAALLALVPHVVSISALGEYVDRLLEVRPSHMLPELLVHYDPETCLPPSQLDPSVLIDQVAITECLKGAGFDVSRLQGTALYGSGTGMLVHRHSWVEAGVRGSANDLNNFQIDVDSENSSPGVQRAKTWKPKAPMNENLETLWNSDIDYLTGYGKRLQIKRKWNDSDDSIWLRRPTNKRAKSIKWDHKTMDAQSTYSLQKHPEEDLTFEAMKRILSENIENKTKAEEERRLQLSEAFRTATFEDLINRTQTKNDALQNKLNDIFMKLSTSLMEGIRAPPTPTPQCKLEALGAQDIQGPLKPGGKAPAYEVLFPELFLY